MPDSPAFVAQFLGSILAGMVPAPVSTLLSPSETDGILDCFRPVLLVTTAHLATGTVASRARARGVPVLTVGLAGESGELHDEPRLGRDCHGRLAEDRAPAFCQFTSGSTGSPKVVMHRHGAPLASCELYARRVLGITSGDRVFSVAKMPFGYGLGNSLFFPLYLGATAVLFAGRCTPAAVAGVLSESRATVFFGVPTAYARLLNALQEGLEPDLSSVRLCVSAGEALPAVLQERWQERFSLPIVDGIGSTELLHIFISNSPHHVTKGSLGEVVPGYHARITDERGGEVAAGERGHLEVKGPTEMLGYGGGHDEAQRGKRQGWIRTGDVVVKDRNGCFWFQGRSDEMLKIRGLWVSPLEVENSIRECRAVNDALVFGRTGEDGLVAAVAKVVPSEWPPPAGLAQLLRRFIRERLAPYKCPSRLEFVQEIPTTATGKKRRSVVQDKRGQ